MLIFVKRLYYASDSISESCGPTVTLIDTQDLTNAANLLSDMRGVLEVSAKNVTTRLDSTGTVLRALDGAKKKRR